MTAPPRSLVVCGLGINCEEELAAAWRLAGAAPATVHLNALLAGEVSLADFEVLSLPGGFSFGDDLGSGKALANRIRFRQRPGGGALLDEIRAFLGGGGYVLGICNGFQALVKLGLLPGLDPGGAQQVSLTANASGRFEDRWVHCRVRPSNPSPFLRGLEVIELPVRHGEGRLVVRDPAVQAEIVEHKLDCMAYCTPQGEPTGRYPANPNGSALHCAALCDPSGQVLGMMPHPEAFLSRYHHPDWPRLRRRDPGRGEEGTGMRLFRNLVEHLEAR
ncbi:MAG: phosphoribosylformylglycinamidine synthase subunit PurQ [Pseudomonadota bacterium]